MAARVRTRCSGCLRPAFLSIHTLTGATSNAAKKAEIQYHQTPYLLLVRNNSKDGFQKAGTPIYDNNNESPRRERSTRRSDTACRRRRRRRLASFACVWSLRMMTNRLKGKRTKTKDIRIFGSCSVLEREREKALHQQQ